MNKTRKAIVMALIVSFVLAAIQPVTAKAAETKTYGYGVKDENWYGAWRVAWENKANEIISHINPEWTDWEKANMIAQLLPEIELTEDDVLYTIPIDDGTNTWTVYDYYAYNPYGTLVLHKGVCEGYSLTWTALLKKAGVNCGSLDDPFKRQHASNLVLLDGVWYYFDGVGGLDTYSLLNTRSFLANEHIRDSNEYGDESTKAYWGLDVSLITQPYVIPLKLKDTLFGYPIACERNGYEQASPELGRLYKELTDYMYEKLGLRYETDKANQLFIYDRTNNEGRIVSLDEIRNTRQAWMDEYYKQYEYTDPSYSSAEKFPVENLYNKWVVKNEKGQDIVFSLWNNGSDAQYTGDWKAGLVKTNPLNGKSEIIADNLGTYDPGNLLTFENKDGNGNLADPAHPELYYHETWREPVGIVSEENGVLKIMTAKNGLDFYNGHEVMSTADRYKSFGDIDYVYFDIKPYISDNTEWKVNDTVTWSNTSDSVTISGKGVIDSAPWVGTGVDKTTTTLKIEEGITGVSDSVFRTFVKKLKTLYLPESLNTDISNGFKVPNTYQYEYFINVNDVYFAGSPSQFEKVLSQYKWIFKSDVNIHYGKTDAEVKPTPTVTPTATPTPAPTNVPEEPVPTQTPENPTPVPTTTPSEQTFVEAFAEKKVDISSDFDGLTGERRYTSEDTSIAKVNKNGIMTIKRSGTAKISCQVKKNGQWVDTGLSILYDCIVPKAIQKSITLTHKGSFINVSDFMTDNDVVLPDSYKLEGSKAVASLNTRTGILTVKKNGTVTVYAVYGTGKNARKVPLKVKIKLAK